MVERTLIRPPNSRMGPITPDERAQIMAGSPVRGLYDQVQDRDSAYESLQNRAAQAAQAAQAPTKAAPSQGGGDPWGGDQGREPAPRPRASNRQSMGETFAKQLLRTVASTAGREIMRGILGSLRR